MVLVWIMEVCLQEFYIDGEMIIVNCICVSEVVRCVGTGMLYEFG